MVLIAEPFPDSDEVDNAASTDNVDGSGSATDDSYLQLRQLTSKLRADLQQLLLFTPEEYQASFFAGILEYFFL